MQQVTIEIVDGKATVAVKGVKGKSCKDVTAAVAQALGGQVTDERVTPEYYEQPAKQANKQTLS